MSPWVTINGGSSVAMLAFIGTLVSRDVMSADQLSTITKPLLSFGCGSAAYFTNLCLAGSSTRRERSYDPPFLRITLSSKKDATRAEVFRWIGVVAVVGSIGCFIWGLASAEVAFSNLTTKLSPISKPARP
jgi:hypothetical protein